MKKIIALAVALAVGSASLFALPAAGVQDKANPVQSAQSAKVQSFKADAPKDVPASALTQIADSAEDDLFADVQAVALTAEEAQAVEGEGPWGAFFGAIAGAVVGVVDWASNGSGNWKTILEPAATGAGIGLLFPW